MRKRVIAGNWKMYKTRDEALSFIYEVAKLTPKRDSVETVICAPSIMLRDLVKREDEHLRIGHKICLNLMKVLIQGKYLPLC